MTTVPPFAFGYGSLKQRDTLHPDLVKVVDETIQKINITLLCGHRGEEEQNKAFREGKSKLQWPNSRHNSLPSEAVDIVPYPLDWNNIKAFKAVAEIVKEVAKELGIDIEWGGDWVSFRDYPHFQLKKK